MTKLRRLASFMLATLALAGAAGCGTGGSGTSLSGASGRAPLDVYVTDAFTDQYKQVIATLFKIELTADRTNFTTVYSSATGQTVDLASLASTAELLASVTVPAGTYTQARVTFGDHITLVNNAGVSTSVAVDSSAATIANGMAVLTVNTPVRVQSNQSNTVFIDFALAEFQLVGNLLRPSIHCDNGSAGMIARPRSARLRGAVSNLSATGFSLTDPEGRTVTVTVTDSTTITSGQTGTTTTLANGQNVIVKGSFDRTTNTIAATAVTLNDFTTVQHAGAEGTVASVDTAAGTFVLTVARAEDIMPTGGTISVVTNASTHFPRGRHSQGTLADVTIGARVEVEGVFDTPTQTLTANLVGIHP